MKRSSFNTNATTDLPNAANSIESAKLGTWAYGSEDGRSLAVAETFALVERIFTPETVDRTQPQTESSQGTEAAIREHRDYRGYRNLRLNLQPNRYRSSGWDRHKTAAPQ